MRLRGRARALKPLEPLDRLVQSLMEATIAADSLESLAAAERRHLGALHGEEAVLDYANLPDENGNVTVMTRPLRRAVYSGRSRSTRWRGVEAKGDESVMNP